MRKQINGKIYDTATAKLVNTAGENELYYKRTGEFFEVLDHKKIRVVDLAEAKEILANGISEQYESYFGSNESSVVTLNLKKDIELKFREMARLAGKTPSEYVEILCEQDVGIRFKPLEEYSNSVIKYTGMGFLTLSGYTENGPAACVVKYPQGIYTEHTVDQYCKIPDGFHLVIEFGMLLNIYDDKEIQQVNAKKIRVYCNSTNLIIEKEDKS